MSTKRSNLAARVASGQWLAAGNNRRAEQPAWDVATWVAMTSGSLTPEARAALAAKSRAQHEARRVPHPTRPRRRRRLKLR